MAIDRQVDARSLRQAGSSVAAAVASGFVSKRAKAEAAIERCSQHHEMMRGAVAGLV
jgi:hypothetical protein